MARVWDPPTPHSLTYDNLTREAFLFSGSGRGSEPTEVFEEMLTFLPPFFARPLFHYSPEGLLSDVIQLKIHEKGEKHLRRFPFVRTDRPDLSCYNENFTIDQNYPAISVKSLIVCRKEMVHQQKPLEKADFIVKITGPVMVRLASSDKWKAP